ncbi:hypothetical protein HDU98_006654 [Podochytrium sp. JEL0797]|nr:hypothetical protein HDU98_006654 [Podochytrium sp. JEL0797]
MLMNLLFPKQSLQEIAPGCFRLQVPFRLFYVVDISTHMHLIRLSTGRFLVLSCVTLDADGKKAIDELTENGTLIDAVIATNAFHTMAFEGFYAMYPEAKYYSTPRHARLFPDIPWAGSIQDKEILSLWSTDVQMRIPEGLEFANPVPEFTNHSNGVVAFHVSSRTVICDDLFMVYPWLLSKAVMFHMMLLPQGINKTAKAPREFYDWVLQMCHDWDFINISTAHGGVMLGNAKHAVVVCLEGSHAALSAMGAFYVFYFIDIGTHMHFLRLASGRFVVLSAVTLTAEAKFQIDQLTNNGQLIEAVIATNPFHTVAFEAFHKAYPQPKYYGTPRHIRNIPQIPWAGSVADDSVRNQWSPEIKMELPAGCEFIAPTPESTNHAAGIVALHAESKTVICDDVFRTKNRDISFHIYLLSQGINKTPKAPRQFYDWVIELMRAWDFDNMSCAHGDVMIGGAKQGLGVCLEKAHQSLSELSVKNGGEPF